MAAAAIIFGYVVLIWKTGWLGLIAAGLHIAVLLAGTWRPRTREASRAPPDSGAAAGPITPTIARPVGGTPSLGRRQRQHEHFSRHAAAPGWLYVARNNLHVADLFKVGYTTVGPKKRMRTLNEQSATVTAAVGEFKLVHERQVPRSYEAEQLVFNRLAQFRARQHREFFQAPLAVIRQAVDQVADAMSEGSTDFWGSPPTIKVACSACGRDNPGHTIDIDNVVHLVCRVCGGTWSTGVKREGTGPSDGQPTAQR